MKIIDNSEWDILEWEMKIYYQLFMNMVIHGDFSHGFTWSLWGKNRARQISVSNTDEAKMLTPTDLGVIAIAVSLWVEDNPEARIAHQYFLVNLWIINNDDIEDHARHMISITRREHVKKRYLTHNVENAWKIIVLRRAYEALQQARKQWKLKDIEWRIILWYVVSMLWWKYEIRPYMVDKEMSKDSWVDFLDHLFDDFSQRSFNTYNTEWFGRIWVDFLQLRNDIAIKKEMGVKKVITPHEPISNDVRGKALEAIKRAK